MANGSIQRSVHVGSLGTLWAFSWPQLWDLCARTCSKSRPSGVSGQSRAWIVRGCVPAGSLVGSFSIGWTWSAWCWCFFRCRSRGVCDRPDLTRWTFESVTKKLSQQDREKNKIAAKVYSSSYQGRLENVATFSSRPCQTVVCKSVRTPVSLILFDSVWYLKSFQHSNKCTMY